MTDSDGRPPPSQTATPGERAPTLVFGFLGRAYVLSRRKRRAIAGVDVLWGLMLIAAVACARFELLSATGLAGIMAAVIALRFAVIKAYLVAMRVPASGMPLRERMQIAYDGARGPIEGAVRTLSITSGIGFIVMTALIVLDNKFFSNVGVLVVGGLAALFAGAVSVDVLVHRYYAKRAMSADRPTRS